MIARSGRHERLEDERWEELTVHRTAARAGDKSVCGPCAREDDADRTEAERLVRRQAEEAAARAAAKAQTKKKPGLFGRP